MDRERLHAIEFVRLLRWTANNTTEDTVNIMYKGHKLILDKDIVYIIIGSLVLTYNISIEEQRK